MLTLNIAPLTLCFCCALTAAQGTAPADPLRAADQGSATFESNVNLVLVPVVVRDSRGRAIGNLTRGDFQLFDKGKVQNITSFSAIERGTAVQREKIAKQLSAPSDPGTKASSTGSQDSAKGADAKRSLLYLFDDFNIRFVDMANVRAAALRHFRTNFAHGDQGAIFTFSGSPTLDFTNDPGKLEAAASQLRWKPQAGAGEMQCPYVSYYMADLVIVKNDGQALEALTDYTAKCAHVRPEMAQGLALAAANRELIVGAHNGMIAFTALRRAIQRLSTMPGDRVIVMASPGFFAETPEAIRARTEILQLAAQFHVVVSGLSVRGVILAEEEQNVAETRGFGRKSPPRASSPDQLWLRYRRESARADGDVLQDLAEGTGGTFFHNNNDLFAGFEQLAEAPAFSYVLGFLPTEAKEDGQFHNLKVRLLAGTHGTVKARLGYYAIKAVQKTDSTRELSDAIFSRDQKLGLPVVFMTGYSKPFASDHAKILLTAKIDLTSIRSPEPMTAVVVLFDSNGAFVTGAVQGVDDLTMQKRLAQPEAALTLHWNFEVTPGVYITRLVLASSDAKVISALNRTVEVH